jgi:hypothetical protein
MMKIDMNKKYVSNDRPIRILCTDRPSGECVIGMFPNGQLGYFTDTGHSQAGKHWDLIEVWEPQVNEWCLFWDNDDSKRFILSKFIRMTESGNFQSDRHDTWQYCAKFTGELPEHMRGL